MDKEFFPVEFDIIVLSEEDITTASGGPNLLCDTDNTCGVD